MAKDKDTRPKEKPNRDPKALAFAYDEFYNNRLSLPDALKAHLKSKDLVWRFMNAQQFRQNGNMHHSHWTPYKVDGDFGITPNAEGLIQRGDLVLGVRSREMNQAHKQFLQERVKRQSGAVSNKVQARELRKLAKDHGVEDKVQIHEGYEEND